MRNIQQFNDIKTAQYFLEELRTYWSNFFEKIQKEGNKEQIIAFMSDIPRKIKKVIYTNKEDKFDIGYQAIVGGSIDSDSFFDGNSPKFDSQKWKNAKTKTTELLAEIK